MEKIADLSPSAAWEPLPVKWWDEAAARHLLLRAGYVAPRGEVARVLADGPEKTLARLFGAMPPLPKPERIAALEGERPGLYEKMNSGAPEERRRVRQLAREQSREALFEVTLGWLAAAASPATSPGEKWLGFLGDVWVVSFEKVRDAALIYDHQAILRRHALGAAPELGKAVSRSPAMILYLDLQQSRRDAPNENFARELFELFTLGEGHYKETDIKEAARAFTGYRQRAGRATIVARQHDPGPKTVFGRTGRFTGDDVIDLVFRQPAAHEFLPREMAKYYLGDMPLPEGHVRELGRIWAADGLRLDALARRFFASRAFYAQDFRGNCIKSPVQFYAGLLSDLGLGVAPLPRQVVGALRQMGQVPFTPPNVRGWIGGRSWINSATLAARRQLISRLLNPINEEQLNADERAALAAARKAGAGDFAVSAGRLAEWAHQSPAAAAGALLTAVRPGDGNPQLRARLERFLQNGAERPEAAYRAALGALLEAPEYQLC